MEQITEVLKKHPVAIGVGVLIVVLLLSKGGSSSSNAGASQSSAAAMQMDLGLATIASKTQQQRDQLTSALYSKSIDATVAGNASNQQSMMQLTLGALGYKATMQQLQDQHDIAQTQLADSTSLASASLRTAVDMHVTDVNAQLSALAQQIGLQHYGIDAATQNLPQILTYQTLKDQTASAEAQAIAGINAQTAQTVAALNTSAARTNAGSAAQTSTVGNISSLAGLASGLMGLFGGGGAAAGGGAAIDTGLMADAGYLAMFA